MTEPGTFITLPREVLAMTDMDWPAKIVWGEVHAFSRQGRPCWLSLAELGRRVQRSPRQVSAYLSQLTRMGMLTVEATSGRRRHLTAHLPDARGSLPPTRQASTLPTSTVEVERVADTRPIASQGGSPLLTNKKQEKDQRDETTNRGRPQDLQEVRDYFAELDAPGEAVGFFDYWESAGWRRKSGPLKDWRAAARNWLRQPYRRGHREGRQLDAGAALEWAGQ